MVEWKKLGEVCTNLDYKRKPITSSKRVAGAYPYYGASGIVDYVEDYIFDGEFLLVSEDGANLIARSNPIAFTIQGKSWVNNHAHVLEFDNKITQKFVELYLNKIDLSPWINGAAQPKLNQANLNIIGIPVPSLEEQQRIVSILDTFTSSISNLKQQIEERRKQYEYERDRLLDMEGKDIIEKLSFGNDFQLKARIGWQGLTKKEYRNTGDYKLVTGTDFTNDLRIDFNKCVYVDKERYEQDEYIKLKVGDVLITKDGTLGKVAYIDVLGMPATLNGGVFVVRDPKHRVLPKFTMYYLTSYHFKKWMQQNHTTGSIQHLTQKLLSSFTIPVLEQSVQSRIVSILDTFEASIKNLEEQLALREKQYEYYRNKLLTFE